MHTDVFKDDAFSVVSLTKAIEDTPFVPGRVGQLGIFAEEGVSTTSISIEKVAAPYRWCPLPRAALWAAPWATTSAR